MISNSQLCTELRHKRQIERIEQISGAFVKEVCLQLEKLCSRVVNISSRRVNTCSRTVNISSRRMNIKTTPQAALFLSHTENTEITEISEDSSPRKTGLRRGLVQMVWAARQGPILIGFSMFFP